MTDLTRRHLLAVTGAGAAIVATDSMAAQSDPWERMARQAEECAKDGRAAVGHARRLGMDPAKLTSISRTSDSGRRAYLTFGDRLLGDRYVYTVTAGTIGRYEWF